MAKYNIREYKESGASYQESINPDILDELHTKILNILLIQRKFMDKDYSAKKLAQDLNTNSRYVSAVCNVKFHMNYATLINKYRGHVDTHRPPLPETQHGGCCFHGGLCQPSEFLFSFL